MALLSSIQVFKTINIHVNAPVQSLATNTICALPCAPLFLFIFQKLPGKCPWLKRLPVILVSRNSVLWENPKAARARISRSVSWAAEMLCLHCSFSHTVSKETSSQGSGAVALLLLLVVASVYCLVKDSLKWGLLLLQFAVLLYVLQMHTVSDGTVT